MDMYAWAFHSLFTTTKPCTLPSTTHRHPIYHHHSLLTQACAVKSSSISFTSPSPIPAKTDNPILPSTPSQIPATPLVDAISAETKRIRANFFCPGHKQGATLHPSARALIGDAAFTADLPELPALDNLFAPEGVLADAQRLAADTFTSGGAAEWDTHFLINGSTSGIQTAILSTSSAEACVVLPRNAHQSAVHGLVLSGATPVWVDPVRDEEHDLLHGLRVEDVETALQKHAPHVTAVVIVSPTYHGVLSDVRAISRVAHAYGACVIVDEAHGAHLHFHPDLPESAVCCEADIVIQSTHKTLTSLTQSAMMHVRRGQVDGRRVSAALQILQSSSPNYLLLASLDATRALMQMRGSELMGKTIALARECARRIASLEGFSVLGVGDEGGMQNSIYALDPTRMTVLLPSNVSGYDIDEHLIDHFGVYAELPAFRHVTFVITPGTMQADIDTLVTSLQVYSATAKTGTASFTNTDNVASTNAIECGAEKGMEGITPRAAFFKQSETVESWQAVGRVCTETLCPYPPGIPVLIAGEVVTERAVALLKKVLKAGGSVSGACDDTLSSIRVVVEAEGGCAASSAMSSGMDEENEH